jgi:hypothetical protein
MELRARARRERALREAVVGATERGVLALTDQLLALDSPGARDVVRALAGEVAPLLGGSA